MKCHHCHKPIKGSDKMITMHIQPDGEVLPNDLSSNLRATGQLKYAYHKKCFRTATARAGGSRTLSRERATPFDVDKQYQNKDDLAAAAALALQKERIADRESQPEGDMKGDDDWREPITVDLDELAEGLE